MGKTKSFIVLLIFAVVACKQGPNRKGRPGEISDRPNIVFLADDQTFESIGALGFDEVIPLIWTAW
ncbi:MAG: hypothetical protein R2814_08525 [Flavobacteriaceae bacterium]